MSDAALITLAIIGFFALLALSVLARVMLRRSASGWWRIRVGIFVERDVIPQPDEHDGNG